MLDRNMFHLAYHKLKSKPGNLVYLLTPGLSPYTLDVLNLDWIDSTIVKLKNESFQFSPARRIQIPKADGRLRPLSIASPRDKIVQEIMRMILETIYEPIFLEESHGFRPGRGCHSALRHVDNYFLSSTWVIEGDIKGCFDNFNHDKLIMILKNKIKDETFIKLIYKALKEGYGETGKVINHNIIGTPQGSIISPILCNIYMHEFDKFVIDLKSSFDIGSNIPRNPVYHRLASTASRARLKGNMKKFEEIKKIYRNLPYKIYDDATFKRLHYCRYADDWIIGIKGTYEESSVILEKVRVFLNSSLYLTLSPNKTKITNLNKDKALFLGANILIGQHTKFKRIKRVVSLRDKNRMISEINQRTAKGIRFEAPLYRIRSKLTQAGFISYGRPNPKTIWISLAKDKIISMYNSIIRGYVNYYRFAANYGKMVSYVR